MDLQEAIIAAVDGMNESETPSMWRGRPFDGQPWTDAGVRGQTEVRGLTMRDVRDCFIRAYILSHDPEQENNRALYDEAEKGERGSLRPADMFALAGDFDPVAVSQNLTCEIERAMNIFSNVPKVATDPETGLPEGTPMYDLRPHP